MQELVQEAYEYVFGREKTQKEVARENVRKIQRAIRELDREKERLGVQEKGLVESLRKQVQGGASGEEGALRAMAKDLVRTRASALKFQNMKTHMQSVLLRMQTAQGTQAMAQAMASVTRVLSSMNASMTPAKMQRVLRDFERNNQRAEDMAEYMGEAIDESFGDEHETDAADEVVSQVLDEISASISEKFVSPAAPLRARVESPGGDGAGPGNKPLVALTVDASPLEASLEERLMNLKK